MAALSTSALGPGASQVLTPPATWTNYSMSWTCSDPSDARAGAAVQGSADDGITWFPLRNFDGSPSGPAGTGVKFYRDQPVTALLATVQCSPGSTVTVSVAGN